MLRVRRLTVLEQLSRITKSYKWTLGGVKWIAPFRCKSAVIDRQARKRAFLDSSKHFVFINNDF